MGLPSIHHLLIAFFRQFMSQPPPTDVQGLFIRYRGYELDTYGWHDMLRDSANSCKLEHMEFCKTTTGKLHEFLVLYFSHHTDTSAYAAVVVDRAPKDPSQSSAIASPSLPSQKATPALDSVHVVGQNVSLDAYLSKTYGKYHKLCTLEYPRSNLNSPTPQPPSAIQISILLLLVTEHQPDYSLYEHNCYWFADMVFEASKKLFLGHRERCYKHDNRGRCRLNLPMFATHDLPNICEKFSIEWEKYLQMHRVERNVIDQEELEQRLEEERRAHREERRAREEEHRAYEEERRAYEEERRSRDAAEKRCKQLQAELQAVRQAQLCARAS